MSCNYRCSCRFPRTVEKENISVYFVTWSIAVEDLSLNVLVPLVTVFHGLRVTNFGHHTGCMPPPHQHSLWHDRIISNSNPSNLRLSGGLLTGKFAEYPLFVFFFQCKNVYNFAFHIGARCQHKLTTGLHTRFCFVLVIVDIDEKMN
jgi:hypothetical protein